MQSVTLVGIDLGKHSFHLHGQDGHGKAVFRKKMNRKQLFEFFATFHTCLVAMEACAGAHYMARKLSAFGHRVKLISPQFVRPFVKSNKNDFVDAEAICEAASRPAMRFVTPKSESQQIHGLLLEFGISIPVGKAAITKLPAVLAEHPLPPHFVRTIERLHRHFKYLGDEIAETEREIDQQLADDDLGQRLLSIPGVGPITASVLTSEMGDGKQYGCSRDFSASIGLVPSQYSTGGKANLLGISKRGNKNIRRLLVPCARSYMKNLDRQTGCLADWVRTMLARRHSNVVACALANKLGRIAWTLATRNTVFDARAMPVSA
ncbi:IS110 family RNA-guided transposase [Cupriavidus pampae]|uniref:IS110 family transposase ISPath1 n=1 Tax=Cupriavidus pampae TaxID=659251 RepID=A0ABN7ZMR2_9BURK|nr:IS110 family transposase [Cupriavidus pampae]CAG9185961.1 IS110 family transposase ISPath1 [Cupriavidus pampae]